MVWATPFRSMAVSMIAMIIVVGFVLASCGGRGNRGGDSDISYKIKMITEEAGEVFVGLVGSGDATIDWGDGSDKVTLTLSEKWPRIEHTYPSASIHTITITGDNITGFGCSDSKVTSLDVSRCTELSVFGCYNNRLTSLDVSQNIALTFLKCTNNQLTSLDMSKNPALTELHCESNRFSSAALNTLFGTLNSNSVEGEKGIYIEDNPGYESCDKSIATNKGWSVL